ncbi:carbon-nitrogen hydrolase family protein [bacterium]|nr:carbon-nitrogen hydrolase family protein [bacterium]
MSAIDKTLVSNPTFTRNADGWRFVTPRPELAPGHSIKSGRLILSAAGDKHSFGCWQGEAALEVGKWYKASVRVRMRDIVNPELSIFAQAAQHFLLPSEPWADETLLEQTFQHSNESDGNKFELYLQAADKGEVEWFDPRIEEIERPQQRIARVATVRFGDSALPLTLADQRERMSEKLDMAGAIKADIVCLPEFCLKVGVPKSTYGSYMDIAEEPPSGNCCKLFAAKAGQYGMYVIAGIVERQGDYLFNTAVIFGRHGELVGKYAKTHLTFGELRDGISCGCDYPVFDLDFGRIAIHICYDQWFPEVARYYAHAGAEILFLPVAGGKPITWRTRALDNGIYFVSSSITPPSMIIDSSGSITAQTHDDGIVWADLDLGYRKVNWYIDPTLTYGMPCAIRQMRNVTDNGLLDFTYQSMRSQYNA